MSQIDITIASYHFFMFLFFIAFFIFTPLKIIKNYFYCLGIKSSVKKNQATSVRDNTLTTNLLVETLLKI